MSPKSTTLIGAGVLALALGLGHTAATATDVNNGVDVGASVGTTSTKLYFTKFGKKVDPKYLCIDWSNIWISGWSK
jgi:hypothetical protein